MSGLALAGMSASDKLTTMRRGGPTSEPVDLRLSSALRSSTFLTPILLGNEMSKLMIALFVTAGLSLGGCAAQRDTRTAIAQPAASPAPISKEAYDTAVRNAETQYKIDKDACGTRSGNAKDICLAEASGKEKIAKADAEAAYKSTPKAREDASIARAEATHNVAKEKCDDLSGNAKDVCVKEADATLTKVKADAKVDRVA